MRRSVERKIKIDSSVLFHLQNDSGYINKIPLADTGCCGERIDIKIASYIFRRT